MQKNTVRSNFEWGDFEVQAMAEGSDDPWGLKGSTKEQATPWAAPGGGAERPRTFGAAPPPLSSADVKYVGTRGQVFRLSFLRSILTILTFGLARFWMTTRLRRHYWSSVRVGGQPLEYTGTALELFIGFLMAVVILAVYLVVVNLGLSFLGFSLYSGGSFDMLTLLPVFAPLVAILPLTFWAQYRAIRYLLARTRWRGVRFGLEPGAWGYMWRTMGWTLLTILTLGLLYPLQRLNLSRYVTGRMHYGTLPFKQEGRLWPLMSWWLALWAGVVLAVLLPLGLGYLAQIGAGIDPLQEGGPVVFEGAAGPILGGFTFLAAGGLFLGYLAYQVHAFRYLHSNKVLGGASRALVKLSFWRVIGIYLGGALMIGLLTSLFSSILVFVAVFLFSVDPDFLQSVTTASPAELMETLLDPRRLTGLILLALIYLSIFAAVTALTQAYVTMPLLRAAVTSSTIEGLENAGRARQRDHDRQAEAGGFADALGAGVGPV